MGRIPAPGISETESRHNTLYGISPATMSRMDIEAYRRMLTQNFAGEMAMGFDLARPGMDEIYASPTTTEVLERRRYMEECTTAQMMAYRREAFIGGRGGSDAPLAKPEKTEIYEVLPKELPRVGEYMNGKFKFFLIDDNMKLYEEGTGMQHCIWRLYQNQFKIGKYVAYHIHAPHLEAPGFTCGFNRVQAGRSKADRPYMNGWQCDQIRGKKNSIPRDNELDDVANMLLQFVQKYMPKEKPDVEKPNPDEDRQSDRRHLWYTAR